MNLIFFELDKTVFKNKGAWLLVLAATIKLVMLATEPHAINLFTYENRADYLPMINSFSGKITQEVSTKIEARYTAITTAQVELASLRQKYNRGEIPEANYYEESRALEKLLRDKELFLTLYGQYIYAREKPEERYLLYENGWNALLTQERLDWGCLLLVILLSASVFGREYEAEMRSLLVATKKGHAPLLIAKFVSLFITVILCGLNSSIVEYAFFSLKFGLPHSDFPLQSLQYFKDSAFELTLGQTYFAISAYRMLGLLILAVITMFISVWTQKSIAAMSVGLMWVVLPYALPVNPSTKYLLPSPLGFILAQGFFRGTQMGEFYQSQEVLFNAIEPMLQIQLVAGWLVLAGVMLLAIAGKFLSAGQLFPRRKKILGLPILLILALLTGCSSSSAPHDTTEQVINLSDGSSRFTVVGDEIVSLYPTFLMENMETHAINRVMRDPFLDDSEVDKMVASIFSQEGNLYYLAKTNSELRIVEIDLSTYRTRVLYEEYVPITPELIHQDLEENSWRLGKEDFAFFLDGADIYILSGMNLYRVNSGSKTKQVLIKNIYGKNVAFNGENLYYIDTLFEIQIYNLATGEKRPVSNLRADFMYMREKKIYYRNMDKGGTVYVYDTETDQNKALLAVRSTYFVCDDDYIYYVNDDDRGYLYRAKLQTGISELIVPQSLLVYNIQLFDDYPFVYFRSQSGDFSTETYRIDKRTLFYEKIEEYQHP